MRDVVLSQNDMLPDFLVLSERECMKILLRLVLFNIVVLSYCFISIYLCSVISCLILRIAHYSIVICLDKRISSY